MTTLRRSQRREGATIAEELESGELGNEVNNISIDTSKSDNTGLSSENKVDEDLKKSFEETDPWLKRKIEDSNN